VQRPEPLPLLKAQRLDTQSASSAQSAASAPLVQVPSW
jgi:hypothetical protein